MGDVYEVNFRDLAFKVAQDSISPAMTRMAFSDGFEQEVPFHKSLRQAEVLVQEHGKITSLHVIPVDKEALADLLEQQSIAVSACPKLQARKSFVLCQLRIIADMRLLKRITRMRSSALRSMIILSFMAMTPGKQLRCSVQNCWTKKSVGKPRCL